MSTPKLKRSASTRTKLPPLLQAATILAALIAMPLVVGCSGSSDGPPRYTVSGEVTFDGKPVPKGFIMFIPDTKQGNSGPGSGAEILDGQYETEAGKGVVGGPHQVEIRGTDGIPTSEAGEDLDQGKELFPLYRTEFNFPKEDVTKDFTVPVPSS